MKSSLQQYLIDYLMEVNDMKEKIYLAEPLAIRALMNITKDTDLPDEFYEKQDEYLKELLEGEEVISAKKIKSLDGKVCLHFGDITLIKADAIINPANYTLIGSTEPLHDSIDSQIHSFAGLQLRRDCNKIVNRLNRDINPGECFVTKGYNLPVKYIIHALGPVVEEESKEKLQQKEKELKTCYQNCLEIADGYNCKTLVIPPISTEEFGYPADLAAKVSYSAVVEYLDKHKDSDLEKVIFCVNNDYEFDLYNSIIKNNGKLNNYSLNKAFKVK